MKTVQSKDGTTIAYDVHGSGSPLIFITGAICSRKFGPVVKDAEIFGTRFAVYNFDRRGRGDSTDTKPYSLEKELDDIESLIDAAGGKAFVYGHSSGAVLALEAALRMPDKVLKFAMYDAPYVHDQEETAKYAKLRQEVLNLIEKKKHAATLKAFLSGIGMPKIFIYLLPFMPGWKTMKALAPTIAYDMSITSDLPPLNRATSIRMPALVMFGGKSEEGMKTVGRQLAKAIPKAEICEMRGLDHMASAKKLLPVLAAFFEGKK